MNVDINRIEESIKAIEAKSDRHYFDMFQKASNGKVILKKDLDSYEKLLQNLSVAQKYVEYRRENETVINGYLRLQEQINMMNMPTFEEDKTSNLNEEEGLVSPIELVGEEDLEEKAEVESPEISETPSVEEPNEEMSIESSIPEELPPVLEIKNAELKPADSEPNIIDPAISVGVLENNFTSDETISRLKNEIIQDMPINDRNEQVFSTPGMTDAEIKESQDWLSAEVPEERKTEMDEYSYKALIEQEITESQQQSEEPSKEDELLDSPKEEVLEQPSKQNGIRHSVVKKENYTWKNKISKKFAFLKGLVFSEKDRSKEYLELSAKIANFRAKFKNRSTVENNAEFKQIEEKVTNSVTLIDEEKKRLYQKLTRLAKKIERANHQSQEQKMQEADRLFGVAEAAVAR